MRKPSHVVYSMNYSSIYTLDEYLEMHKRILNHLPNRFQLSEFTEEQFDRLGKYLDSIESDMAFYSLNINPYESSESREEIEKAIKRAMDEFENYRVAVRLARRKRLSISAFEWSCFRFVRWVKRTLSKILPFYNYNDDY